MSLRDQIMKAKDINGELMDIKEWGVKVEIRTMTARERAKMPQPALTVSNFILNLMQPHLLKAIKKQRLFLTQKLPYLHINLA